MHALECNKINRKEDFQVKSTSVFYIFEKHHICPVVDPELFVKRGGKGGGGAVTLQAPLDPPMMSVDFDDMYIF